LLKLCVNANRQTNFVYLLINAITMMATMKYINSGLILAFIVPPENMTLASRVVDCQSIHTFKV
jgi:hypothetical protein